VVLKLEDAAAIALALGPPDPLPAPDWGALLALDPTDSRGRLFKEGIASFATLFRVELLGFLKCIRTSGFES